MKPYFETDSAILDAEARDRLSMPEEFRRFKYDWPSIIKAIKNNEKRAEGKKDKRNKWGRRRAVIKISLRYFFKFKFLRRRKVKEIIRICDGCKGECVSIDNMKDKCLKCNIEYDVEDEGIFIIKEIKNERD